MYTTQDMLIEEIIQIRTEIENGVKPYNLKAIRRCEKIERELNSKEFDARSLIKEKYKILKIKKIIDSAEKRQNNKIITLSIYLILGFELMLIFYKFASPANNFLYNLFFFMSLAVLGYLGALTHLYTKVFRATNSFELRALLALIFPIIFLNICKIENEQITGVYLVNLIIFIGGYNTEVIFGVLNKLVDMAKKAVNIPDKDAGIGLRSNEHEKNL